MVSYIRARLHDKSAQTLDESSDHTVYSIEMGRRLRRSEEQLVTVVFDLKDAPLSSLDIGSMQFMVYCFQSFYPEILAKVLVVDAPWIFWGFWRLVRPLLDPVVAAKIDFVKREDIAQYVESRDLPREFEGEDSYTFQYTPPDLTDYPLPADQEVSDLLLTRIGILRVRFIEMTREMHALLTRYEAGHPELELVIAGVREKREQVKTELRNCYEELDALVLPRSFYERTGIVDEENDNERVNWKRYQAPSLPSVRQSAPPALGK